MCIDITVVVACYNCERTIKRCVESIIIQNKVNIEVILINDGSKDKTLDCIKQLVKQHKDSDIKIVNIKNSGVSIARNKGLDLASKTFISFVDSDDFIEDPLMYYNMANSLSSSDNLAEIAVCGFRNSIKEKPVPFLPNKLLTQENLVEKILVDNQVQGFVWNKMYRLEVIKRNNIRFNEDMAILEDLDFNLQYCRFVSQAKYSKYTPYIYCVNEESAMFSGISLNKIKALEYFKHFENYGYLNNKSRQLLRTQYCVYGMIILSNIYNSKMGHKFVKVENDLILNLKLFRKVFLKNGYRYGPKYYFGYFILLFSKKIFKVLSRI